MLTEEKTIERDTLEIMCTEMLVPKEHLLRKIDAAIDFQRLYEIVGDLYCNPDCGVFHKGDHKKCFAYGVQTACDGHNYILGVDVHAGNMLS